MSTTSNTTASTSNNLLAKVKAPQLGSSYTTGFADMVNTINENFKKIASAPFLTGDDGASFTLVKKKVWETATQQQVPYFLTAEGAMLMNAIFEQDGITFTVNMHLYEVCNKLKTKGLYISYNGKTTYPVDSFFDRSDSNVKLINNDIYFYETVNDAGVVTNTVLGQYFFFADERLKVVGKTAATDYKDKSGLFTYIPAEGTAAAKFERLNIVPTIYYDNDANCMCWMFNGIETGIPAQGLNGNAGADAHLFIVKTAEDVNAKTGPLTGWFYDMNGATSPSWSADFSKLGVTNDVNYPAIIMCEDTTSSTNKGTVFGMMKVNGSSATGFWDSANSVNGVIAPVEIKKYFDNIGQSADANQLRGLKVPSNYLQSADETQKKKASHLIYADNKKDDGTSDLFIKQIEGDGVCSNTSSLIPTEKRDINIDYNVNITGNMTIENNDGGIEIISKGRTKDGSTATDSIGYLDFKKNSNSDYDGRLMATKSGTEDHTTFYFTGKNNTNTDNSNTPDSSSVVCASIFNGMLSPDECDFNTSTAGGNTLHSIEKGSIIFKVETKGDSEYICCKKEEYKKMGNKPFLCFIRSGNNYTNCIGEDHWEQHKTIDDCIFYVKLEKDNYPACNFIKLIGNFL